jgi:hypothetical protein
LWAIPGGTYLMTAVPGDGADAFGAAAIPPTDGRWGALSAAVTPFWPAVTQVGTPSTVVQTTAIANGSVTGSWSGSQPRTFGDLLIACVTAYGDTSLGTTGITETSGTWARQGYVATAGTAASIFVKVAGGGDAAPSFAALMNGTVSTTRMTCYLIELNGNYLDTSSVSITTSTGTTTTTITAASPVAYLTSYAITCWNVESLTGAPTWTPGASWTNASSTAATSTVDHAYTDVYAAPPVAALTETPSQTTFTPTHTAGVLALVAPITTLYTVHGPAGPAETAGDTGGPPVAADPFPMPEPAEAAEGK